MKTNKLKITSFWKPVLLRNVKLNVNSKSLFSSKHVQPVKLSIYPKRTSSEIKLIDKNPWKDSDRDRVPNIFDCRPLNKNKQGRFPTKKEKVLLKGIMKSNEKIQSKYVKERRASLKDYDEPIRQKERIEARDRMIETENKNILKEGKKEIRELIEEGRVIRRKQREKKQIEEYEKPIKKWKEDYERTKGPKDAIEELKETYKEPKKDSINIYRDSLDTSAQRLIDEA